MKPLLLNVRNAAGRLAGTGAAGNWTIGRFDWEPRDSSVWRVDACEKATESAV